MKKTLITIGAILGSILIILWAYNSAQEKRLQDQRNREYRERVAQQELYYNCTSSAYEVYTEDWNSACRLEYKGNDCTLPLYKKEIIDESYQRALDRCVELYK